MQVDPSWPVLEDPSSHAYIRPEGGGLMVASDRVRVRVRVRIGVRIRVPVPVMVTVTVRVRVLTIEFSWRHREHAIHRVRL